MALARHPVRGLLLGPVSLEDAVATHLAVGDGGVLQHGPAGVCERNSGKVQAQNSDRAPRAQTRSCQEAGSAKSIHDEAAVWGGRATDGVGAGEDRVIATSSPPT